jgi:hypothetical protein
VAALNTILGRWGQKASRSPAWNISGEPCSGAAVDSSTEIDGNYYFNPEIKCDCSFNSNTICHITKLYVCPILSCFRLCTIGARRRDQEAMSSRKWFTKA